MDNIGNNYYLFNNNNIEIIGKIIILKFINYNFTLKNIKYNL